MLEEERSAEAQAHRRALLTAVAAEIALNQSFTGQLRLTEPDDSKLTHFTVYPRFRSEALSAALASGRFDWTTDHEFFTGALQLSELVKDLNHRLDTTEEEMRLHPKDVQMWRIKLRDSGRLSELRANLKEMRQLIIADYGLDVPPGEGSAADSP